ncbi:DUF192 domain-containing protein [Roseateles oligotrophus]|nr:DUF192 domain-containing protein [Roseateles oligotrophus]
MISKHQNTLLEPGFPPAWRSRFGPLFSPASLLPAAWRKERFEPSARRHTAVMLDLGVARSFGARFWGLMGRPPLRRLPFCEALLLVNCKSVHSCFVRAPIDLAFLDAQGRVLRITAGLKPWRLAFGPAGTTHVLELPATAAAAHALAPGCQLEMRDWLLAADGLQQRRTAPSAVENRP